MQRGFLEGFLKGFLEGFLEGKIHNDDNEMQCKNRGGHRGVLSFYPIQITSIS